MDFFLINITEFKLSKGIFTLLPFHTHYPIRLIRPTFFKGACVCVWKGGGGGGRGA